MGTTVRQEEAYKIVRDDSGHWYVIPARLSDTWEDWLDSENALYGDVPAWAEGCQNPSNITFYKYDIE